VRAEVSYLGALVLTLVVEAPVWALLLPLASPTVTAPVTVASVLRPGPDAARRSIAAGSAATCVTHPVLWFVAVPALRGAIDGSVVPVLLAEVGACVVEGLLVAWWLRGDRPTCLGAAAAANALSLAVGLVLW
jgi:hypothetical protein